MDNLVVIKQLDRLLRLLFRLGEEISFLNNRVINLTRSRCSLDF